MVFFYLKDWGCQWITWEQTKLLEFNILQRIFCVIHKGKKRILSFINRVILELMFLEAKNDFIEILSKLFEYAKIDVKLA